MMKDEKMVLTWSKRWRKHERFKRAVKQTQRASNKEKVYRARLKNQMTTESLDFI